MGRMPLFLTFLHQVVRFGEFISSRSRRGVITPRMGMIVIFVGNKGLPPKFLYILLIFEWGRAGGESPAATSIGSPLPRCRSPVVPPFPACPIQDGGNMPV